MECCGAGVSVTCCGSAIPIVKNSIFYTFSALGLVGKIAENLREFPYVKLA
jgi:hypothetical protein